MDSQVRNLLTNGLWRLGLSALVRRILTRGRRFALNFHGVSARHRKAIPSDLQPHHDAAEFRQVLGWLAERVNFLTVEEFLYASQPGVLLTFDDGHANNLANILPILADFHVQGLFFISTQHVFAPRNWLSFTLSDTRQGWGNENAVPEEIAVDFYDGLSVEQLQQLSASPWALIGGHTVTHPSLPTCSAQKISLELLENRDTLRQISGQPVNFFAYPYGDYNQQVAKAVRDVGYLAAFAVDALPIGWPAYEIPRVGIYASRPSYLDLKLSGLHRRAVFGPIIKRKQA